MPRNYHFRDRNIPVVRGTYAPELFQRPEPAPPDSARTRMTATVSERARPHAYCVPGVLTAVIGSASKRVHSSVSVQIVKIYYSNKWRTWFTYGKKKREKKIKNIWRSRYFLTSLYLARRRLAIIHKNKKIKIYFYHISCIIRIKQRRRFIVCLHIHYYSNDIIILSKPSLFYQNSRKTILVSVHLTKNFFKKIKIFIMGGPPL